MTYSRDYPSFDFRLGKAFGSGDNASYLITTSDNVHLNERTMRTDDVSVHIQFPPEDGPEQSIVSVRSALKDIAFGSFAGMVAEVFEYPFDLAKVRLQSQLLSPSTASYMRFHGPMDCLKQTWKDEGFRGLYRGLPAPMVGAMGETAALFLAYSSFQNLIRAYSPSSASDGAQSKLSISQLALAAGGAGFVTSFILTPIELVKCKMQVQMMNTHTSAHIPPIHIPRRKVVELLPPFRVSLPALSMNHIHAPIFNFFPNMTIGAQTLPTNPAFASPSARRLPGPLSIIQTTIHTHGVRGLWLGHTGTLLRETGGTAAWFSVKELVAEKLRNRRRTPSQLSESSAVDGLPTSHPHKEMGEGLLPWESALSGAIAGAACVLALYPADTVKSAMQTEEELRPRSSSNIHAKASGVGAWSPGASFFSTFKRMYVAHGIKGLYAGCGMTVAKAIPSSGIVFVVYDGLSAWIG